MMKEKEIVLSIINPHHNIPRLLQRCLSSIPGNDDIQVIVVDDNSNEDKVDFDNFPGCNKKNTEIYLTKEGRGASYARNIVMGHAKGKWLLFADSDVFFTKGFVVILSKWYDSNNDMILFKSRSVDSDTQMPSNRDENINKRIDEYLGGKRSSVEASLLVQSPWCRLIRRDFVEINQIRFDEVMACNDTMFTIKAACLASKIDMSSEAIYVVTTREVSLWSSRKTNPKNYLTRLEVQINRNKYIKNFGYKQSLFLSQALKARQINCGTLLKALWLVVSRGALIDGMKNYFFIF